MIATTNSNKTGGKGGSSENLKKKAPRGRG
jgi:hypothetical protein